MSIRAINLKLVVPRAPGALRHASALWSTHNSINAATRYYEEQFLVCRQRAYQTRNKAVSEKEVAGKLLGLIAAARKQNRYQGPDNLTETLASIRLLYESIVPSAVGKSGNAQNVGGFVSPLLDPGSKGFTEIYAKLDGLPNWIDGVRAGDADAVEAANDWLASPQGQQRLKVSGAPTKWMKLAKSGDQGWPGAFVEDIERLKEEVKRIFPIRNALCSRDHVLVATWHRVDRVAASS
jgi:hypothetical protein